MGIIKLARDKALQHCSSARCRNNSVHSAMTGTAAMLSNQKLYFYLTRQVSTISDLRIKTLNF